MIVKTKILIVSSKIEDRILDYTLLHEPYEIIETDINDALKSFVLHSPSIIIMQMGLYDRRFLEACHFLRLHKKSSKTAILFLSGINDEDIIVKCLEAGADFYLKTPITSSLMLSKIQSISRRYGTKGNSLVKCGNISIDREGYMLVHGNASISLPKKEFELLELLISKAGNVFLRNEIRSRLWNNEVDMRTVDVHICRLRQKLGGSTIKTVKGIGYKISV